MMDIGRLKAPLQPLSSPLSSALDQSTLDGNNYNKDRGQFARADPTRKDKFPPPHSLMTGATCLDCNRPPGHTRRSATASRNRCRLFPLVSSNQMSKSPRHGHRRKGSWLCHCEFLRSLYFFRLLMSQKLDPASSCRGLHHLYPKFWQRRQQEYILTDIG